jgi:hypothetical protein
MRKSKFFIVFVLVLTLTASGCGFYEIKPSTLDPQQLSTHPDAHIHTPTKAHLKDGSVVIFSEGFKVVGEQLIGKGEKYDLSREKRTLVEEVTLSDVAALEVYEKNLDAVTSTAATVPTTVFGVIGGIALFKAIFGSCPTVYSLEGEPQLEAELFSHSINRRFESEDLDLLSEVGLRDGGYHLRVANEAPETHYINRLTLETVDHPVGTRAFPTYDDKILIVEGGCPFVARNRLGEDLTAVLTSHDGVPYRSNTTLLKDLADTMTEDWIELTVPVPPDKQGQPMVVTLRLRNTLMATVLLYDVMLKAQGIHALDWLGDETKNPFYAWRIHRWFGQNYGLHVQSWNGERFVPVASLSPTGPIAWHEVAVSLPPSTGPEARIRLSSLPDNWMVDWVGVGYDALGTSKIRAIAAEAVDDLPVSDAKRILVPLRANDKKYFKTSPGESHTLFFPAEPPAPGTERTCFLRSGGFYIEWLREDWFKDAATVTKGPAFEPGNEAIQQTAKLWIQKKPAMEKLFLETKIPLAGAGR